MKLAKFSKGQMAVIMTLVIATLLGVMALGADVGVMYYIHMQLQKGADAAALAGATYQNGAPLPANFTVNANCTSFAPDIAKEAACTYAVDNHLAVDSSSLTMNEDVAFAPSPNLQVIVTRTGLPYMFARLLPVPLFPQTYKIAAVATAADPVVNEVNGLFPMGMQCASPCKLSELVPGQSVPFDVKFTPAEGGAPGNWQWLNNGQGANGLGGAITDGMSGDYSIGDTIGSEPGNKGNAGPVKTAFSDRFNNSNCPSLASDPCSGGSTTDIPQGDPCLVTVPAVDFQGCTGNCTMTIEAFAQVYIEPGSTSKSITACYIQAADANAINGSTTATNLGTSIIRLYQ